MAEASGQGWPWIFLTGLGVGAALVGLGRRRLVDQALRDPRACLLPEEVGRLRLLLSTLEDIIVSVGQRGRVVRLGDWLRAKGREPGSRL
jgi:hypothetical protein